MKSIFKLQVNFLFKFLLVYKIVLLLLQSSNPLFSQSLKYEAKISFVASSRFGKVEGEFKNVDVVVTTNPDRVGSQILVDIKTISTGNKMRDNHLKDEDFFHVSKYPQASFTLLSLKKLNEKSLQGKGSLTIKSHKKEIEFLLNLEKTSQGLKYIGEIELDRTEFGVDYNSFINPISEKVLVRYEILEKIE